MHPQDDLGRFIAGCGRPVNFKAGQVLFREGDESTSVYACVSGRINVFITTPTGREVLLGFKVPTQAFGELSAIDGAKRSAGAVAVVTSTVALMTGDEFLEALARHPELSLIVLRELSAHVRRVNARLSAGTSENTTERVGHLLIELAEKFSRHGSMTGTTELLVTQDEIAAWVGATREATARSLATFRQAGAVETGRNKVTVVNRSILLTAIANR